MHSHGGTYQVLGVLSGAFGASGAESAANHYTRMSSPVPGIRQYVRDLPEVVAGRSVGG